MVLFGRRKIITAETEITDKNILEVLTKALSIHAMNVNEITYLYNYYKGQQPILERVKTVRPEITNNVVENRANQIVTFKVGYLMGEPVQYVSNSDDENITVKINALNDYMSSEDKAMKDIELAEWMHICGTGYRIVLPDISGEEDEAPFEIYNIDPRNAFVVYFNGLGELPAMGVTRRLRTDGVMIYSVYTKDTYYEIEDAIKIVKREPIVLGIPIIEYPLNNARLGAFEIVLDLLDSANEMMSDRVDAVEQFVQAIMLFHNVNITEEQFEEVKAKGALKFKDIDPQMKGEVKYLIAELNQSQTEVLTENITETILTICGMPNRQMGASSTSDNVGSVVMRDGWSDAETRASHTEGMFKKSERELLKLVLKICDNLNVMALKISDIGIHFTRRNYENITQKADVLVKMLSNPMIAPQLAFEHCGMFVDAESAYIMSMKYAQEVEQKELLKLQQIAVGEEEDV